MQSDRPTTLERAFSLAESGAYRSKAEIARALWQEGYRLDDLAQLSGPTMSKQLRTICQTSRAARSAN